MKASMNSGPRPCGAPMLRNLRAGIEARLPTYILTTRRSELAVIGHLSGRDWESVKVRARAAFAI
jgi:hypothetical protein